MTGKEALLSIKEEYYIENSEHIITFNANDDRLKIIKKDLEILTILHDKENVFLECIKVSNNYKDYVLLVYRVYGNVKIDITEQDYNLLKRWLENDK